MIDPVEYERRYYGRIYGKRRARVAENQDPERRGRVKVENTEIYGASVSPWCMPSYPFYGGVGAGFFAVPPVGSMVWIECEEGLPEYPIYTGGFFDLTSGGHPSDGSSIESSVEYQGEPSTVPAHGRGDYDGSDFESLKGSFGVPPSTFEGEYGKVTILQTESGHKIELDDTEGGERIQIHHKRGAHIEILPDGSINLATEGRILTRSGYRNEIVESARNEFVGGKQTTIIEGDEEESIYGSVTRTIQGTESVTNTGLTAQIDGSASVNANDLTSQILNNVQLSLGGDLGVISFGDMALNSSGKGTLSFSNAVAIPEPTMVTPAANIQAINGTLKLTSSDVLNTTTYGVEMRGGIGGHVYLGSLGTVARTSTLGVTSVPLLKERAVLGEQLNLFLTAVLTSLETFYSTTQTGGSTPGFGGPNPVLSAASIAALASLSAAKSTFITSNLILSDTVYLSKA